MTLEEIFIALYQTTETDFQKEFSTRMNPMEYNHALSRFRGIHDHLFSFLYSLKPLVTKDSDTFLIELVDEMDKFLETEDDALD